MKYREGYCRKLFRTLHPFAPRNGREELKHFFAGILADSGVNIPLELNDAEVDELRDWLTGLSTDRFLNRFTFNIRSPLHSYSCKDYQLDMGIWLSGLREPLRLRGKLLGLSLLCGVPFGQETIRSAEKRQWFPDVVDFYWEFNKITIILCLANPRMFDRRRQEFNGRLLATVNRVNLVQVAKLIDAQLKKINEVFDPTSVVVSVLGILNGNSGASIAFAAASLMRVQQRRLLKGESGKKVGDVNDSSSSSSGQIAGAS